VKCRYCDTVLNDGSEWILERVLPENSREYAAVRSQKTQAAREVGRQIAKSRETEAVRLTGREVVTIAACVMMADGKIEPAEEETLK
jgi:tellurite resistance protein